MAIASLMNNLPAEMQYSFEVLPPLKGTGTGQLYLDLEKLCSLNPAFINITTHHSEFVYNQLADGKFVRQSIRRRPGTVAVAAAIKEKFNVTVQPHVICSGATVEDIEYELLDLQFLGITDLLLLRGDKAPDEKRFRPSPGGHLHTTDLIRQVVDFNNGFFSDGSRIANPGKPFDIGVACYPEKHEESPNLDMDLDFLKMKQDAGAHYAVTQMFFDNSAFFRFIDKARSKGVTMPLIPGLKPLTKTSQLSSLPRTFRCDIPSALAKAVLGAATEDDARKIGEEWTVKQCEQLRQQGMSDIHFYTMGAVDSIVNIVSTLKSHQSQ